MTLYQFKQLNESDQLAVIWEYAVTIAHREDEIYRFILYSLFNFHVEYKFLKESDIIHERKAFCTDTALEPYLHGIDISGLKL